MGAIYWLDAELLGFTEQVVKKFNWLTSKDQFFLAKALTLVAIGSIILLGVPRFFGANLLEVVGLSISFLLLAWIVCFTIDYEARDSIEQSMCGVKSLRREKSNFYFRVGALAMFVLFSAACIYRSMFIGIKDTEESYCIFSIFLIFFVNTAAQYLVSVDYPPFKRSQALEWVKNAVRSLVARPALQPVGNR